MRTTPSTPHTLIRHSDIRAWVTDRKGIPAIARVRDRFGEMHPQLRLSFQRQRRSPETRARADDGMAPCSWTAWLAELDRQNLALRVAPGEEPDFEFVPRSGMN